MELKEAGIYDLTNIFTGKQTVNNPTKAGIIELDKDMYYKRIIVSSDIPLCSIL